MNILFHFGIISLMLFASISAGPSVRQFMYSNLTINGNQLTLNVFDSSLTFFALGDWGGSGLPLIHKTPSELSSAGLLSLLATTKKTNFQIGLGDNFYFYGVTSVTDNKFHEIFEEVYIGDSLKQSPWFHTLGNHDYYGNAQAQIDYMSVSNRWILPNYNYSVDIYLNNGKKLISLIMIDTIKLCGNTKFSLFSSTDTSSKPTYASTTDQNMANLYFDDLNKTLSKASTSGVPYIIVAGHFPVYSVAEHGSTQCLIDRLAPMLHKYKVSAYLSGHDHNLQHISVNSSGSTVEYMVSGANSLNANSKANLGTIPTNSLKFQWPTYTEVILGGFLMFQGDANKLTVNFMKSDGTNLYQKVLLPRV